MGKKTLEEIGRILLISFISIIITLVTARRTLIDDKLDKAEYYRDKEKEADDLKDIKDMVLFLYENEIKKGS